MKNKYLWAVGVVMALALTGAGCDHVLQNFGDNAENKKSSEVMGEAFNIDNAQKIQDALVVEMGSVPAVCGQGGAAVDRGSSSCADFCSTALAEVAGDAVACTRDLAPICSCGPDSCWNGERCVVNPTLDDVKEAKQGDLNLGNEKKVQTAKEESGETLAEICKLGGASIGNGSSSCADFCTVAQSEANGHPSACTTDLVPICSCGHDNCWNGEKCVSNPEPTN